MVLVIGMAMGVAGCKEDTKAKETVKVGDAHEVAHSIHDAKDSAMEGATGSDVGYLRRPGLMPGTNWTVEGPATELVVLGGPYECSNGGTVEGTGSITWTYEQELDVVPLYFTHRIKGTPIVLTLSSCQEPSIYSEGLWEVSGEVSFEITEWVFHGEQDPVDSDHITLSLDENESFDGSASATNLVTDETVELELQLSVQGHEEVEGFTSTGEGSITAIDLEYEMTYNGTVCTGTWTDPDDVGATWDCQ
jgi:hypothetical protein